MHLVDQEQFDYITSEKFIHDGLLRAAQRVIEQTRELWMEKNSLASYMLTWPSKTIRASDGIAIDRAVLMEMPARARWQEAASALVRETSAYGLLLIDVQAHQIVAKFETAHGARAWFIPIERHGDRLMLGDQRVKDNAECVGLLWSPSQGSA